MDDFCLEAGIKLGVGGVGDDFGGIAEFDIADCGLAEGEATTLVGEESMDVSDGPEGMMVPTGEHSLPLE